ncbi:hypothetical protein [Rhodocyclus gracilis]|uniref:Phosphoglycerate mutase n=1 Tax=Rhodocyclus tenuis TaxID=1066 RepID=A0A6L5JWI4_RHOTE|nr:hypothetical protein [Rhodocyclus gracilis]MQY50910.1 hypothetical protein [Rhodocyclus gracilis]
MPPVPHLTLLVPELLRPPAAAQGHAGEARAPQLEKLLARSQRTQTSPRPFETLLAETLGHNEADGYPLPFAAWRRRGDGLPDEAGWLCADPVHLRFLKERMALADSHRFSLGDDEAKALVAALNAHFAGRAEFVAGAADHWYLRLIANDAQTSAEASLPQSAPPPDMQSLALPPLSAVSGRGVSQQLPQGAAARPLRQLLLEAQMLLSAHPLNTARSERGELPINSLWLWGNGATASAPAISADALATAYSDNALVRGLAGASAQTKTAALPGDASAWLAAQGAQNTPTPHALIVCDALLGPAHYDDEAAWQAALADLEQRWFAPLAEALWRGRLSRLTLLSTTVFGVLRWQANPAARWQFWRRPQTLAQLACHFAASDSASPEESAARTSP